MCIFDTTSLQTVSTSVGTIQFAAITTLTINRQVSTTVYSQVPVHVVENAIVREQSCPELTTAAPGVESRLSLLRPNSNH